MRVQVDGRLLWHALEMTRKYVSADPTKQNICQRVHFQTEEDSLHLITTDGVALAQSVIPASVVEPGGETVDTSQLAHVWRPELDQAPQVRIGDHEGKLHFQVPEGNIAVSITSPFPEYEHVIPSEAPTVEMQFGFTHGNTLLSVMRKLVVVGGPARAFGIESLGLHLRYAGALSSLKPGDIRYVVEVPLSAVRGATNLWWGFAPQRVVQALEALQANRPDWKGFTWSVYHQDADDSAPFWIEGVYERPPPGVVGFDGKHFQVESRVLLMPCLLKGEENP